MGRHCKYLTPEFEKLVEDELAKKKGIFDSAREKLQIIRAAINMKNISAVAKLHKITTNTLCNWIKNLHDNNSSDKLKRNHPGAKKKLSDDQWNIVLKWLEKDSQLTCTILAVKIGQEFGVKINIETVRKNLKKRNYSFITSRPQHPQQDLEKTEEFKKNSLNYTKPII